MVAALLTTTHLTSGHAQSVDSGAVEAAKIRAVAAQGMDVATREFKDGLDKLRPLIENAKTEAEKNKYAKAVEIIWFLYINKAIQYDLWAISSFRNYQPTETWKKVVKTGSGMVATVVVPFVSLSFVLKTAEKLLIGPFKSIYYGIIGHFTDAGTGKFEKLVTAPIRLPLRVVSNLLFFGVGVSLDITLAVVSLKTVYAAWIPLDNLDKMIAENQRRLNGLSDELAALDLY